MWWIIETNNLIPGETALLGDPELEILFYKRFAEQKLQTYDFIGKVRVLFQQLSTVHSPTVVLALASVALIGLWPKRLSRFVPGAMKQQARTKADASPTGINICAAFW